MRISEFAPIMLITFVKKGKEKFLAFYFYQFFGYLTYTGTES